MSDKKPDNPPAFPCTKLETSKTGVRTDTAEVKYPGMDLRDYFAAKAMQGYIAADPDFEWDDDDMIKQSYAIADAMLAERDRTP